MKTIEFLYDFGSPNAFLVHQMLPDIAGRYGAQVMWCPVLLGGVFKETNNQAPMITFAEVAGKNEYLRVELDRFVERHALRFSWNPHFPVNTLAVMRGAVFASGKPWERTYVATVFQAMWVDGRDMSDTPTISEVLSAAGLPTEDILAATSNASVKGQLVEATTQAVSRGVFGAPTMFLDGEMFFGKDALSDLEWRLS